MTLHGARALEDLFADLPDRSGEVAPVSRAERDARVRRLGALLVEHDLDALLLEPSSTLAYLSGVAWGTSERLFALLVLADASVFWIAPGFERLRAEERIAAGGPDGPVVTWEEHEYAWRPLHDALRARGVRRLAVDPRARAFVLAGLIERLGAENVRSGADLVRALRCRKDAHELALLRKANEITKDAILAVSERLTAGTTDHELGAMLRAAQSRMGLVDLWVLPLLAEGAAYPHGAAGGRVLAAGDTVLVDTGGSLHGYQSDVTRTWVFGAEPGADVRRAWSTVRDAQRAAFAALRPGVACRDVDRAARAVIEAAGYGDGYAAFAHRLGHGIGLDGHEEPCLDGGSRVLLEPGMTFSNEPGIYLPGRIGLRIEDVVVVTDDGADVFGGWQLEPESPRSEGQWTLA